MQYVALAFLRRDKFLHLVGEEDDAHLVVVLYGRESECRGYFGHRVTFHLVDRTEVTAATDIDEQHHRQLAFLFIDLDVGAVHARRYVPVDGAHVIAWLIFAHLAERHTTTFKLAVVFACEDILAQPVGLDLYLPNFL